MEEFLRKSTRIVTLDNPSKLNERRFHDEDSSKQQFSIYF